jgi:hypothetical protein
MNPQIFSLAQQASGTKKYIPPVWQFFDYELEHFAQLLIKECARIADVNQAENMDWNIGEIIKEHFGVES